MLRPIMISSSCSYLARDGSLASMDLRMVCRVAGRANPVASTDCLLYCRSDLLMRITMWRHTREFQILKIRALGWAKRALRDGRVE